MLDVNTLSIILSYTGNMNSFSRTSKLWNQIYRENLYLRMNSFMYKFHKKPNMNILSNTGLFIEEFNKKYKLWKICIHYIWKIQEDFLKNVQNCIIESINIKKDTEFVIYESNSYYAAGCYFLMKSDTTLCNTKRISRDASNSILKYLPSYIENLGGKYAISNYNINIDNRNKDVDLITIKWNI